MARKNWQKIKIQDGNFFQSLAYKKTNNLFFEKRKGRVVTLEDGKKYCEFISCGYLGLEQDKRVVRAAKNIDSIGITFPASRSRLQSVCAKEFEHLLSKIFDSYVVPFQNLHVAHLGMLPLIASGELPSFPIKEKGPVFVLDQSAHASLQINRGLMQQFGEVRLVNLLKIDLELERFLEEVQPNKTPIFITDSVGSMGHEFPVEKIMELCDRYDGYAYIDDAHGTSVTGKNGRGYTLEKLHGFHPRLILAISLAKAFGIVAAAIAVKHKKDMVVIKKFCSTYIFCGPLSYPVVQAGIAAAKIHLSDEIRSFQENLKKKYKFF